MLTVAARFEQISRAMKSLDAAFLIGVEGVTEVWLVRHADCYQQMVEVDDPPLSEVGRDQARRLAERVKHIQPAGAPGRVRPRLEVDHRPRPSAGSSRRDGPARPRSRLRRRSGTRHRETSWPG